jgi:hypothetical protein
MPGIALDSEQRMYSIVARLGAEGGLNKLMNRFSRLTAYEWEQTVWDGLRGRNEFITHPSLVQLFNPHAARGYSLLKPSGTDRNDKSKNSWGQPFLEWLRYRGYFQACSGSFLDKDIRLYTAWPARIDYRLYKRVMQSVRDLRFGGSAPKIDCRTVLALTRLLIDQMEVYLPPASFISHLSIANYRNMGQANTLMAMDQCAIPDWLALKNDADATLWRKVLDEHDKVLRRLNDSNSDHLMIIKQYRRSLQTQKNAAIEEFVRFLEDYGLLLFKTRAEAERWILPQFSLDTVTAILSSHAECRLLLFNPAFLSIARAIRDSTVSAQVARHNDVRNHRDIRYGLLSGLKRSARLGAQTLGKQITEFVRAYNAETVRRHEMRWRDNRVADRELASCLELISICPPALLGSLLCALATCRRSNETEESSQSEFQQAAAV